LSRKTVKDDDGVPVGPGDRIAFSYGMPPRRAYADVVEYQGMLLVIVDKPHKPRIAKLRSLRRYVDRWYMVEAKSK
jgi:hypothetical protein